MVKTATTKTVLKKKNSQNNQNQKPMNDNKDRKIFVTKNKRLIKQYYKLRNRVYCEEWGLTHEKWQDTSHDENSEIVVFTVGGKVFGGVRILISKNGELLSEEYEGTDYTYSNLLEKAGLPIGKKYAEIVDLIADKDFRGNNNARDIVGTSIENARSQDCHYIVSIAPLTYCRLYKKYAVYFGCKNVKIMNDFPWKKIPEYNYSKDYPILAKIR